MNINTFIDDLAKADLSRTVSASGFPQVCNQYSQNVTQNQSRRENLRAYLHCMAARQPQYMLIGEAPGYRGARLTGIPFASPYTLTQLSSNLKIKSLEIPTEWPHIRKEASATIMWETLAQVTAVPLIWNAFPFHPHKPATPQSNRKPTTKELERERPFFQQIVSLFPIRTIIAVGNTASQSMTRWQIPHEKVRHPSHGGKVEFQEGIFKLLK